MEWTAVSVSARLEVFKYVPDTNLGSLGRIDFLLVLLFTNLLNYYSGLDMHGYSQCEILTVTVRCPFS